jgi:hypothetical protein
MKIKSIINLVLLVPYIVFMCALYSTVVCLGVIQVIFIGVAKNNNGSQWLWEMK